MKHRDQLGAFMLPRDMQRNDRLLRHILSPSIYCGRAYVVAEHILSPTTMSRRSRHILSAVVRAK